MPGDSTIVGHCEVPRQLERVLSLAEPWRNLRCRGSDRAEMNIRLSSGGLFRFTPHLGVRPRPREYALGSHYCSPSITVLEPSVQGLTDASPPCCVRRIWVQYYRASQADSTHWGNAMVEIKSRRVPLIITDMMAPVANRIELRGSVVVVNLLRAIGPFRTRCLMSGSYYY
ncbi:hypothetical protein DL93DRAFT_2096245 [Clavulina sp. PMI_390]|nr:hypothetical protein DL93DRAFT_2096245 [Clavulina sp. PMI_390]